MSYFSKIRIILFFLFYLGNGFALVDCKRDNQPEDPHLPKTMNVTQVDTGLPKLPEVQDGRGLIFTFFDHRGVLLSVEQIEMVPDIARAEVMVTDPKHNLSGENVFLTDLRKKKKDDTYRVWQDTRGNWLDRVMPKSSQLDQAAQAQIQKAQTKRRKNRRRTRSTQQGQVAKEQPKIVMFSTSWCGSCKTARAYFSQRGLEFLELDVEKNPEAAQQMAQIQQRFNLKQGVVPLLIINGRPLQGFSAQMVESALASAPSPAS